MIKSSEYIHILNACHDIIPKIREFISEDYFYSNLNYIRENHNTLNKEFDYFKLYPRADMRLFYDAKESIVEFCKKSDVMVTFSFPENVEFDEKNWADFKGLERIVRYYFKDIEITRLINVE